MLCGQMACKNSFSNYHSISTVNVYKLSYIRSELSVVGGLNAKYPASDTIIRDSAATRSVKVGRSSGSLFQQSFITSYLDKHVQDKKSQCKHKEMGIHSGATFLTDRDLKSSHSIHYIIGLYMFQYQS